MKRTGPPQRHTGLKRTGRLNPVSARRRKRDRSYLAARAAVFERADGRCEAPQHADDCSGRCEQVHHRQGRNVPDPHALDNLVGLSERCHVKAHLLPGWAFETGLSVRRNWRDDEGEAYDPGGAA